jgi:nucleoside-diphosphate-sugar epimerase
MSLPRVFVTGASGMVGRELVSYLVARGYRVTGLIRRTSKRDELAHLQTEGRFELVEGDILDGQRLSAVMSGHDLVVHAAGTVDPYGSRADIFSTNVEGTRTAMRSAADAAVKQFVHVSSLSVITDQNDSFNLTEEAPLRYCGEAYADSKVEAEKLLIQQFGFAKVAITIARPGFIYGPGERAWMPRLISSLTGGKVFLIDGGQRETNLIYSQNLCRAIEATFLNQAAYGQVYNLTDGERVTKKQLFDFICTRLALPPVTRVVPRPAARLFCELVSTIAPALPVTTQRKLARFSRAAFRLAGVNQGFSIAKAERELGYVDRIPFSQGMTRTLEHIQSERNRSTACNTCRDEVLQA